jgi:glycogen operon protein
VQTLIAFRRDHPVLRRREFLRGRGTADWPRPDVAWHGVELDHADWGPLAREIAMHLAGEHAPSPDCDVYLAVNCGDEERAFALPAPPPGAGWARVVDTARRPEDIPPRAKGAPAAAADSGGAARVHRAAQSVSGPSCRPVRVGLAISGLARS